jgi:hypothetical protein
MEPNAEPGIAVYSTSGFNAPGHKRKLVPWKKVPVTRRDMARCKSYKRARHSNRRHATKGDIVELNDKMQDDVKYTESTFRLEGDMQSYGTLFGSTGMARNPEDAY